MSQGKGMDFARRMMEKCGWSEGKGLGRDEGGITEAIRPKLKFDTAGLNYNKADEFNFHWWDHVFNKAAHNITVHKNQDDVVHISRSRELEVSTKRPSKKHARDHSGFIKGKTLIGQCGEVAGLVECSDDDEEEEKDRSLKLTDEQLFQMCEGRTAHKGARHGLNMTAKLARVKEQDRKLMEAWNKSADNLVKEEKIYSEENLVKKKKKKKRSVDNDLDQMPQETVEDNDEKILVTQEEMPGREKKSKKRHQQEKEEETEATNTEDSIKIKKKKKKKRNRETDDIKEESIGSESIENCRTKKIKSEWQSNSINEEEIICGKIYTIEKKKKKKKDKEGVTENVVANTEENAILKNEKNCPVKQVFNEFIPEDNATDGKKKSKSRKNKEGDLSKLPVSGECVQESQRKKKKKKKSKDKIEGLL